MKKCFFHYCIFKNSPYLCTAFERNFPIRTGCSAVRLAHLLWEQGVVGSNPATPTKKKEVLFFFTSVSGCSAVRLAHQLWELGVVGSNPATPTKKNADI